MLARKGHIEQSLRVMVEKGIFTLTHKYSSKCEVFTKQDTIICIILENNVSIKFELKLHHKCIFQVMITL